VSLSTLTPAAVAPPENEWLRRVAGGDKAALRLLYDRLAPGVMALALRLLSSREEAEEVVQETFTQVWRSAATFREERGNAGAWISTIARHRAVDRLRARRDTDSLGDVVQQVADTGPMPQDLVSSRHDGARVRRALDALPSEQRSVVLLAYFHGLSQSEIAAQTGQPLGTIKTRVRLAMEKLGGMLRAEVRP
jgi:RNA polymerase sigma-70 factor (ECF subfamily)